MQIRKKKEKITLKWKGSELGDLLEDNKLQLSVIKFLMAFYQMQLIAIARLPTPKENAHMENVTRSCRHKRTRTHTHTHTNTLPQTPTHNTFPNVGYTLRPASDIRTHLKRPSGTRISCRSSGTLTF